MKRIIIIVLLLATISCGKLLAQSIQLVRSDVDSTRAHFITATFRFGVDVKLTDSPGCTGAAFELRYTNASVVRFSGWSAGSFGSRGTIQVDQTNLSTGAGKISVGSLSGDPAFARGIDNPIIVHLDFVVTPDAVHNQSSIFTFVNAQAIINKDSGSIVQLTSNATPFAIRSFIKVWPGDADNNGIVDTRDASQIGRFIGNNDSTTKFRGFKRQPGSTYWSPQTALAWDSSQATYTDCDGNGDVTITDLMVVPVNFGKTVSGTKEAVIQSSITISENSSPVYPLNFERVPIFVSTDRPFLAASATVQWDETDADILGIESGELFCGKNIMLYSNLSTKNNSAQLAIGDLDGCQAQKGGILAYLIFVPRRPGAIPYPMLQTPTGITASGLFFSLQSVSKIQYDDSNNYNEQEVIFIRQDQILSLSLRKSEDVTIEITTVLGQVLIQSNLFLPETTLEIDISTFPKGVYFAIIKSNHNSYLKKIILP